MDRLFQIHVLGSSAATPTSLRHTTAQLLRYHNKNFLLDCAEGTQMQLRRMKLPVTRINHIFISHLHGDHYLGLPGLLFSLHLLGRTSDLNIFSPPGLKEVIEANYRASGLTPSFRTLFHEIASGEEVLYDDKHIRIESIAMRHRISCYGFLIREKPAERKIHKESILRYNIPVSQMHPIKRGMDFITEEGKVIPNKLITLEPGKPRSYAFCSDTGYTESFLHQVSGVDILYHEATFLKDKSDVAKEKTHCTTVEAASLALKAGAGKLLIGHFSARYKDLTMFEREAREVFANSHLVHEGDVIPVTPKN